MRVCFHINIPSFHQEDLFYTLSKKVDLLVRYESDLPDERKKLGWSSELKGYKYVFEREMKLFERYSLGEFDYHIISGFPGSIKNLIKIIKANKSKKIFFQSEYPGDVSKKWLIAGKLFKNIVNKKKIYLLGIGEEIRNYWLKIGVNENLIFPWAYFIDKKCKEENFKSSINSDIIFVGQLIHRKGIDILLKSFSIIANKITNNLILVGEGKDREKISNIIKELKLQERVKVLGSIPSNIIQEKIATSSLLILPSRFDGWGVVTNEAILNNVPVIVSDKCGSKELVEKLKTGYVFNSENYNDLSNKTIDILTNFEKWNYFKENCRKYSNLINTYSAANYLIDLLKNVKDGIDKKIVTPWFI